MSKHPCLQISFRVKLSHPLDSHGVRELQPRVGAMAELCVGRGRVVALFSHPISRCWTADVGEEIDSSYPVHLAAQNFYFHHHGDFLIFWIIAFRWSHVNRSTWFRDLFFLLVNAFSMKNTCISSWLFSQLENQSWTIRDERQFLLPLTVEQKKGKQKDKKTMKKNDIFLLWRNLSYSVVYF